VSLDEGDGVVVAHQVPADSVVVRMNATGATMSCSRASVCGSRKAYESKDPSTQELPKPRGRHR
jgi:hypothetical protein